MAALSAVSELFSEESSPQLPRPQTALGSLHSASIRITDRGLVGGNPHPLETRPHPVSPPDNQFLSPHKLRQIAGVHDLSKVVYLELSVNTSTTSLGNFGFYLTQLNQLRLYSSHIQSIRDLGTSLCQLRVLWMASCNLRDLDGLAALPSLQELYIANNNVKDISLISLLTNLEVLDIEKNFLFENDQLGYLCLCPSLTILTLAGNPITQSLQATPTGYRTAVRNYIPQLKLLDDEPYEDVDLSSFHSSSSHTLLSPSLASGWRSMIKGETISPLQLQNRAHRSVTAIKEDSSDLTHGTNQVICGNPVRALKARLQLPTMVPAVTAATTTSSEEPRILSPPIAPPTSVRPHTASDFRSKRYIRPTPTGTAARRPGHRSQTSVPASREAEQGDQSSVPIATSTRPVNVPRVVLTHRAQQPALLK